MIGGCEVDSTGSGKKKEQTVWRRQSTSGFHAVRTSKLDEKILVSQEGLCFMQLGTDLDATEKGGSSYLQHVSDHIQDYTVSKSRILQSEVTPLEETEHPV